MYLGFIASKMSYVDSEIIKKIQELIQNNSNNEILTYTLINAFFFYLKSLLTSKFNADALLTIVKYKSLY